MEKQRYSACYHRIQTKAANCFPPKSNLLSFLSCLIFTIMYSNYDCLISHYSKLIVGKQEGKKKRPEAEKPPVLAANNVSLRADVGQ